MGAVWRAVIRMIECMEVGAGAKDSIGFEGEVEVVEILPREAGRDDTADPGRANQISA
jgi:hypothetical protein